jgi:succinyl-CoA synthetase beta subunit
MGFLNKLFGKGDTPTGRQLRTWFKDRELAKSFIEDQIRLQVLLAHAAPDCSDEKYVAIMHAAASGKYKIVPSVNGGVEGFDLVIFY